MKISIRQKPMLFSFIILVGFGTASYAVYKSIHKLLESSRWVEHTQQVILQSGNILSIAKDIQTYSQGYIITNDSAFLNPLYNSGRSIFLEIGQLRQLMEDNPAQQQRLDSLNFYVHLSLDFSLSAVEIRSKQGLQAAIPYV